MTRRSKDPKFFLSPVVREKLKIRQGWVLRQWSSEIIVSALTFVVAFISYCCNPASATRHLKGSTMGTFYTVTYRADIAESELKPIIEKHLATIEAQLSTWDKDSWISRFNRRNRTDFMSIPQHAYRVIKYVLELATQTNGTLDPTLGNLINLWGFGPAKTVQPPDIGAIQEALKATGPENLAFKDAPPRISKKNSDLQLNVSAVAKGYAVDLLARQLEAEGITDYLVNIGGEIHSSGHPENDSSWTVAIQRPDPDSRSGRAYVTIGLSDAGLATSGDYRRFLEIDGKYYPHILDPETGQPVQTDLASATIIAPTSMEADGLATACLVLGLKRARELVSRMSDVEGLFIQRIKKNQFRAVSTSGWPESKLHSQIWKGRELLNRSSV